MTNKSNFAKLAWGSILRMPTHIYWWLKCHLHPKYMYHKLNLKQPLSKISNIDNYSYGWIDADTQILYANFNILNSFVENELPNLSSETEQKFYKEIRGLYKWWNIDRKESYRKNLILQDAWWNMRGLMPQAIVDNAWKEFQLAQEIFDAKEEEMLILLIKIRKYLWI
jgi:hypothetical protein